MIIPSKEKFIKEVEKIKDKKTKEKLNYLYEYLVDNKDMENVEIIIDEIIKELYPALFSSDNMIPYKFMESPIGIVLFSILYNYDNYLSVNDVIEMSKKITPKGFSRPYINQEILSGNLNAEKVGGGWKLREKDVNEYFKKKVKKRNKNY